MIFRILSKIFIIISKVFNLILAKVLINIFRQHGNDINFFPTNSFFSYKNIELGSSVYIGPGAYFSSICTIKIGNKVLFGPNVTIITGDHRFDIIGEYIYDITEKKSENDLPVSIEDDVWIGCNVTILKGVRIGRGSIVAAGSLVNKNVAPYSIVGGVPAKKIGERFSSNEIIKHEEILNQKNNIYK